MEELDFSTVSSSRRTRSQVAPDWTVQEILILANAVAIVEAECSDTFPSFQKWKMISKNCNALDVARNLDQCRSKWGSLLAEHALIKKFDDLYWTLDTQKRKRLNLPENFDFEIFEAVENVLSLQEDKAGTEPEPDREAEPKTADADMVALIPDIESVSKKPRKQLVGSEGEGKFNKMNKEEISAQRNIAAQEKPRESSKEQIFQTVPTDDKKIKTKTSIKEKEMMTKMRTVPTDDKKIKAKTSVKEKETMIKMRNERKEKTMTAKLLEKAELIHAIVKEDVTKDKDPKDEMQIDFVRRQGDRLIACLGDIVNTLNAFHDVTKN